MILDNQTNFLYFSELLKQYPDSVNIFNALNKHKIKYDFLKSTCDIWCRDYMPIQVDKDTMIQFKYEPSYLNPVKYHNLKSIPSKVNTDNNIKVSAYSEINLDGGNVIKFKDKVIISERVFSENPFIEKRKLINEIENLLKTMVIIMPDIKMDMTGHADGLVRYYNENTILIKEIKGEYKYWQIKVKRFIKENNFNYIEVPWYSDTSGNCNLSAIGCYINFLNIGNLFLIPFFGNDKYDNKTLDIFEKLYPSPFYKIEPVYLNSIPKNGGVLNCVSWGINYK